MKVINKINTITWKNLILIRNIEIKSLIYADNIMFLTNRKVAIEKAIRNCRIMKKLKTFTFNNKPDKLAVLKTEKGKKKEKRRTEKQKVEKGK